MVVRWWLYTEEGKSKRGGKEGHPGPQGRKIEKCDDDYLIGISVKGAQIVIELVIQLLFSNRQTFAADDPSGCVRDQPKRGKSDLI